MTGRRDVEATLLDSKARRGFSQNSAVMSGNIQKTFLRNISTPILWIHEYVTQDTAVLATRFMLVFFSTHSLALKGKIMFFRNVRLRSQE